MKKNLTLAITLLLILPTFLVLLPRAEASSDPYIVTVGISYEEGSTPITPPITQTPEGHMRLWYHCYNPNSFTVDAILGATIQIGSSYYDDPAHDKTVTLQPGNNNPNRYFYVPSGVPTGSYTVIYAIWAPDWSEQYDSESRLGWISMVSSASVQLSSSPSDIGAITWDSVTYSLPTTVYTTTKIHWSGTDDIHCTPPSGYLFDHWEATGSVDPWDEYSQWTSVNVDGDGSLKAIFESIPPELCQLTIDSYPFDDIGIKVDGVDRATPHTESFEYATNVQIEAKASQIERNGETYVFDHWIDYRKEQPYFYSKSKANSYTVPSMGHVMVEAIYIGENDVPWHLQGGPLPSKWCGPASLEMVFDFYGADISQSEIATAARTAGGTNLANMRRAAHFSDLSTEDGLNGYTARSLGYAAFEYQPGTSWLGTMKSLIDAGYPVIVNTHYDQNRNSGHYRVVVGYDDSDSTIRLHDPWDPEEYGLHNKYGGAFLRLDYEDFENLWTRNNYWGLLIHPWVIDVVIPEIETREHFELTVEVTYPCPNPFTSTMYSASSSEVTITLPDGFSLESGEALNKQIGNLEAGSTTTVVWRVIAPSSAGSYAIGAKAYGVINGVVTESGNPTAYSDRIGGTGTAVVNVERSPQIFVPTDYATIQEAVNNAIGGDKIIVKPGIYYENVVISKPVSIYAEAEGAIIDGMHAGSCFTIKTHPPAHEVPHDLNVSGFTIINGNYGIEILPDAHRISIFNNSIRDNNNGILIAANRIYMGPELWEPVEPITGVSIFGNEISDNIFSGIVLEGDVALNLVYANNITNNGFYAINFQPDVLVGIGDPPPLYFTSPGGNRIYFNNFINNTVSILSLPVEDRRLNMFFREYSGGNYWSDHIIVDDNYDGIADSPYVLNPYDGSFWSCYDVYPLIKPYAGPHDIGIIDITSSDTKITAGNFVNITVRVITYGNDVKHIPEYGSVGEGLPETFNVTIYANTTILAQREVTLYPRHPSNIDKPRNATLTFAWNTTDYTLGNYATKAYAWPLQDEIDIADNLFIYEPIQILPKSQLLQFSVASPVNILVTAPNGLRVGFDHSISAVVNEIEGATYSGPGTEPQEITIPSPLPGVYIIDRFGTGTGPYTITIESVAPDGTVTASETWTGTASLGELERGSIQMFEDGSFAAQIFGVIPEVPWGTVMASVAMIVALVAYVAVPKWRRKRIRSSASRDTL